MTQELQIRSVAIAVARRSLDDARNDLDDVVRSLAEVDGEAAAGGEELVLLLLRVVAARRHLNSVERDTPSHGPRTSFR